MRAARRTDRYHWAWHRWARYVAQRLILRPIVNSTVRVNVEGEANLQDVQPPYIVVANHSSHLDAPLLVTALPWRITRHMAVAVAADYFYEQRWRRTLTSFFFNSYPVERGRGKKREAGLSVTLLREDVPLAIFPEGTRSRTGQMSSFKPGVAALARALRVPVLPVALVGAHDAMPPGARWPKPGRLPVKVIIGKPLRARPGENLPDLNDRLATQVRHMLTNQTPYVLVPEAAPSTNPASEPETQRDDGLRAGGGPDDDGRPAPTGAGDGDNPGAHQTDDGDQPVAGRTDDGDAHPGGSGAKARSGGRRRRSRRAAHRRSAVAPGRSDDDGADEAGGQQ